MGFNKKDFEPASKRGNSHRHEKRTIVNAILYVVKSGIQWRLMANDFPPWQTVYDHFSRWNKRGVWERALDRVIARHRKKAGRAVLPTYGIIDAQSAKRKA